MGQIRLGDFGNSIPRTPGTPHATANEFGTGAAIAELGQTVTDVSLSLLHQQRREEEKQRHEAALLARATANNAILDHEIEVKTLAQDVSDKVHSGQLSWRDAEDSFNSTASLIEPPKIDGLDAVGQMDYGRQLERKTNTGRQMVIASSEAGKKADFKTQVDGTFDRFAKIAGMPGADIPKINASIDAEMFDQMGQTAYGGTWGRKKQDFRDANWTNQAINTAALNRDNLDGLKKLETELTSGFYIDKMDPEKRNAVLQSVIIQRDRIQNRVDHTQDRREAAAEREVNSIDALISSGVPIDPQRYLLAQQATKGTQQDGVVQQQMAVERTIQKVLTLPPDQQQAFVDQEQVRLDKTGAFDAREVANFKRMKSAVETNVKTLRDDPLTFQQNRTGVPVQPLDLNILQSPDGAKQIGLQLADRVTTLTAMQKQYGPSVPMAPLLKGEAETLKGVVEKAPDMLKLKIFGGLAASMPADAYLGVIGQLKTDAPLSAAGVAAGRNLMTNMGNSVGETILAGRAILADKSGVMPKLRGTEDDAILPTFDAKVGDALPAGSAEREPYFQITRAVYAALAQRENKLGPNLDTGVLDRAIAIATGGIGKWGGKKVIKPWGMTDDVFENKVDSAIRLATPNTAFNYEDLKELPLQSIDETHYRVLSGRKYIPTKDGRPLIIEVKP